MIRHALAVVAVALVGLAAGPAAAQPTGTQLQFEFATAAGVTASSFSVGVGGQIDLQVYLRVVADPNANVANTGGFLTAAVRVSFDHPERAAVAAAADISGGAAWSAPPATDVGATSAALALIADGTVAPAVGDRVLLGTFRFTAGQQTGDVNLTADDYSAAVGDISGADSPFHNYDPVTAASGAVLHVMPVPEPGYLLAAVAVPVGYGLWGRRRGV